MTESSLRNYNELGLKVGLEIHQQLDTHKLFCKCPSVLSEISEKPKQELYRKLRPVRSELGDFDTAALEESKRGRTITYQIAPNSCLVEADEEPPHEPNPEAVDIALEICGLLKANPVHELSFMRKIVIDGSNTTGFQRTGLIAYDGKIELDSGIKINIPTICLEEDAARRVEAVDSEITYRLDRLGIPEIEITTAPEIHTPEDTMLAARKLGELLRATGKVRHGIGTIRQDINISIEGGARCEIKLVQDLNSIPKVVELEVERQLKLLNAKNQLAMRSVNEKNLTSDIIELTEIFTITESKFINKIISKGGTVCGIKLKGFKGLFKDCLGPELAYYARTRGVKGLLHTDELPGYGVSAAEVEQLCRRLDIDNNDGFVLIAGNSYELIRGAMDIIIYRSKLALECIPNEVRGVNNDHTTYYQRPMPGAARMYPETDVSPIQITDEKFQQVLEKLPELFEAKRTRFVTDYGISEEQARQLINTSNTDLFEQLVTSSKNSKLVAQTLLNTLPELKTCGVQVENLDINTLKELFEKLDYGLFAKEAIPEILNYAISNHMDITSTLLKLSLSGTDTAELEDVIESLLSEPDRQDFIQQKGMDALGPLMGVAMGRFRGKADGKFVSQILKKKLQEKVQNRV